jgi:hypothetical protein
MQTKGLIAVRGLFKYNIYSNVNSYKSAAWVGFCLGLIPVKVLTKSFLTLQCGVPWASHELFPFSSIISFITRYAKINERATSDEEVSFKTVCTVFHVCSLFASVLLHNCNIELWRCDIEGKR